MQKLRVYTVTVWWNTGGELRSKKLVELAVSVE